MGKENMQNKKPMILVLAGPSGSGKSTITAFFDKVGKYTNADDVVATTGMNNMEAARFYISVSSPLQNDVLNIKHIAELLKCSVCLMCKNPLCKQLSKLNTFLVEAVYIP